MPVVACKLLIHKGQYDTCQIKVPDVEAKLSAVKIDDQYYSLFRRVANADAAMKALQKLAQNGDAIALTKQKNGGYVMWALEPNAQGFRGPRKKTLGWPTKGPATCLMLGNATQYQQCYVQVPDLMEPVVAVNYEDKFYSVYQPGLEALDAFDLAAQLTGRGNTSAIVSTQKGEAVCLWEPEATVPTQPTP